MSTETYSVNIHSLEMPIETHFENTLVEISVEAHFIKTIVEKPDLAGCRILFVWENLVPEFAPAICCESSKWLSLS